MRFVNTLLCELRRSGDDRVVLVSNYTQTLDLMEASLCSFLVQLLHIYKDKGEELNYNNRKLWVFLLDFAMQTFKNEKKSPSLPKTNTFWKANMKRAAKWEGRSRRS